MDPAVGHKLLTQMFLDLEQPVDKVQCMHVYVDGTLRNFRTKDQTWPREPQSPDEFPLLEFCGSATDFGDIGDVADYYAKPIKLYKDPFRGGPNIILFCETYSRDGLPTFANNRYRLLKAEIPKQETAATFNFYQSYTFMRKDGKPLSYMDPAYDPGSKSGFACGRIVAESHYKACLYAGVKMASLEPVTSCGKWRYSVGGSTCPVELSDDAWMCRFLLLRVAEDFGVAVNFEKEPAQSDICLEMEDVSSDKILRIVEALLSKFVMKEHKPVKIRHLQHRIILAGFHGDIDPYDLCKKILDAFTTVS